MAPKMKNKQKVEAVKQKTIEKIEDIKPIPEAIILQSPLESIQENIFTKGIEKVPGIEPLTLSADTQKLFNCVIGDNVTENSRIVSIQKENILNDINERKECSEFFPFYQVILKMAENINNEILVSVFYYTNSNF
ncbi:uncharacterized protein LOC111620522 isoform X2 [Centruroides sculpturatus]|uniref:uncharacterized protein LOC111620522 isoform X2 n=1 Tax=Centruroides sculpturatus TaxID=218467 RepID=UPI000C6E57F2|nr:uncharacterized protein LOC111620522 isoform X2 [Centruroides sculpturatus]